MRFGFYLSKSEIRGLCAFAVLLLILTLGIAFFSHRTQPVSSTIIGVDSLDEAAAFFKSSNGNISSEHKQKESKTSLFPFDPNTADSATFAQLGLPGYLSRRIVRYRSKGGQFREASDLQKIYGLSDKDYHRLLPYIRITRVQEAPVVSPRSFPATRKEISVEKTASHHSDKFESLVHLDINSVDSLTLVRIPGIGPYYAFRFLKYRKQLGGYISVSQLEEIANFPKDCLAWFYVDNPETEKIPINEASFSRLVRHPYLNYEQVKAIFNYRRRFGPLVSLHQLSNLEVFTSDDLERLRPYISF